jgi:hypothetical protein
MARKTRYKYEESVCDKDGLVLSTAFRNKKLLLMNMFFWTLQQAVCQKEFVRHLFVCLFVYLPNTQVPRYLRHTTWDNKGPLTSSKEVNLESVCCTAQARTLIGCYHILPLFSGLGGTPMRI